MERNPVSAAARAAVYFAPWCLIAGTLVTGTGCVKLLATVLYRGRMAPAACEELKGRRVAVVCTSNSTDFGPNPNADLIARNVGALLAENVKKIDVVSQQKIAAWMDEHDMEYIDHAEIGRAVQADMVVAIDVEALRLQDSQTLYKGRADYRLEVIDVKDNGRVVFAPFTPPVIYPRISGLPTTSVAKEQFRQKFVEIIADDVARHFYAHDLNQQVAIDPPDLDGIERR